MRSSLINTPFLSALLFALFVTPAAWSQDDGLGAVEVNDAPTYTQPAPTYQRNSGRPVVGRRAAAKYMPTRNPNQAVEIVDESNPSSSPAMSNEGSSGDSRYLAIHIGGYVSDTAYKWGSPNSEGDVGKLNLGVTYRLGEWINTADFAMRVDYSTYDVQGRSASKLSFVPVILFPDANSKFPLYFGVGAGLGVFVKQLGGESALALDYQLLLGARFFDLFNNAGFFIEAGMKNHLKLLSDGQFNGTFVTVGSVFTF